MGNVENNSATLEPIKMSPVYGPRIDMVKFNDLVSMTKSLIEFESPGSHSQGSGLLHVAVQEMDYTKASPSKAIIIASIFNSKLVITKSLRCVKVS